MRNSQPMNLTQLVSRPANAVNMDDLQPGPAPISDNDAQQVGRLLEQLKLIFPAWKRAFPNLDAEKRAGREWTRALVDADCTSREQLARGMRQARLQNIPFFPAPGQFIKWCEITPESMGLPTVGVAYQQAVSLRMNHPAVKVAEKSVRYERKTLAEADYRAAFERAYQIAVRRVMNGEDLEAEILKALPTREQVRHSPEYYREAGVKGLALVRAKLGTNNNGNIEQ